MSPSRIPAIILSQDKSFAQKARTSLSENGFGKPVEVKQCEDVKECLAMINMDTVNFIITDYEPTAVKELKSVLDKPKYTLHDVKLIVRSPSGSRSEEKINTDDDDFVLKENKNEVGEIQNIIKRLIQLRTKKDSFKNKNYIIAAALSVILLVAILIAWL